MQCSHEICTCTNTSHDGFCSTECRNSEFGSACPCTHDDCTANAVDAALPLT